MFIIPQKLFFKQKHVGRRWGQRDSYLVPVSLERICQGTMDPSPCPPYLTRSMTLLDIPIILANCRIDTPSNSFNSKIIAFLISLSICCKELLVGKPNLFR